MSAGKFDKAGLKNIGIRNYISDGGKSLTSERTWISGRNVMHHKPTRFQPTVAFWLYCRNHILSVKFPRGPVFTARPAAERPIFYTRSATGYHLP